MRHAPSASTALLLALMIACDGGGPKNEPDADVNSADVADAVTDATDGSDADDAAEPDAREPDVEEPPVDADDATMDAGEDDPDATEDSDADDDSDADAPPPEPWRSALYPEDWTGGGVDTTGPFLHDFSYAGYRGGEEPPDWMTLTGEDDERLFDVTSFGAAGDGTTDDTAAFAAAIDAAEFAGGVVLVPEGTYRIEGTLRVTGSDVVLAGGGPDKSRLLFPSELGSGRAHITFAGAPVRSEDFQLARDAENVATVIALDDVAGLAVGDDIEIGWTITDVFIEEHGMTGTWGPFNGTWQPFFRREIVAIDTEASPQLVTLDVPLRYPALVRDGASVRSVTGLIRECGVEGLGVANAVGWEAAWQVDQVALLEIRDAKDCWVRDVATFPSPFAPEEGDGAGAHVRSSGIRLTAVKRVTVADCTVEAAQNRGPGGNGYLFEVRQSSEVLTRDSVGRAGRHNFIQNWGFGATGSVWLRVHSSEGRSLAGPDDRVGFRGLCDFHHSLATANLVDSSVLDDGWSAENRGTWSSGAGHSATQNVAWNTSGEGALRWYNFGLGYVIGTAPELTVATRILLPNSLGTEPEDYVEGAGTGAWLVPASLYEDQRARRLDR